LAQYIALSQDSSNAKVAIDYSDGAHVMVEHFVNRPATVAFRPSHFHPAKAYSVEVLFHIRALILNAVTSRLVCPKKKSGMSLGDFPHAETL
jgi:hypothetical protein